jgi:hypothetical protein
MPKRKAMFDKGLIKDKGLKSSSRHQKRQVKAKMHYIIVGKGKDARFVRTKDKNMNEYIGLEAKGIAPRNPKDIKTYRFTGKSRLLYNTKQPSFNQQ